MKRLLKKAFLDEVLTEFNFSETKDFSIIEHQKGSSKFRIVVKKELGKNLGKMHASVEAKGVYAGFDSLSGLFLDKEMQSKYSMNNEDIYLDNFLYFIKKMEQYPV